MIFMPNKGLALLHQKQTNIILCPQFGTAEKLKYDASKQKLAFFGPNEKI